MLRPTPIWLALVLFATNGIVQSIVAYNLHPSHPHKEVVFLDSYGKERKLDGDDIKVLHKVLMYQGLEGYDIGTMQDLAISPMSVTHNIKNDSLHKSILKLISKGWVEERNGLWSLTYDGRQVAEYR